MYLWGLGVDAGVTTQRGRGKGNAMGEGGQRVAYCLGDIAQQHLSQRALTGQPKQLVASSPQDYTINDGRIGVRCEKQGVYNLLIWPTFKIIGCVNVRIWHLRPVMEE